MMNAMYGKKVGMTRIFTETGEAVPVTVLEMIPNVVFQVKTKESDGYSAIQVGIGEQKMQRVNKPTSGHVAKAKAAAPRELHEIRLDRQGREMDCSLQVGDVLKMEGLFSVGELVDVTGISTGKGFAGVMKKHHMKGAQTNSHGTHEYFRHGGSVGNRKFPGRVFKNKAMPAHMGAEKVTQQALTVVGLRAEDQAILVRGSVPGRRNSLVLVQSSVKA
ncbi:MAG: 50S ribosomal protein L3 [Deltaproteobacteria bacterium]|nr:50S ribosomal protein L3 [Deltaproteobacteria bacterium]